jgi:hypothetical protein
MKVLKLQVNYENIRNTESEELNYKGGHLPHEVLTSPRII